jgi:hypothetical protein
MEIADRKYPELMKGWVTHVTAWDSTRAAASVLASFLHCLLLQ